MTWSVVSIGWVMRGEAPSAMRRLYALQGGWPLPASVQGGRYGLPYRMKPLPFVTWPVKVRAKSETPSPLLSRLSVVTLVTEL